MALSMGKYNILTVLRESDLAYILTDGRDEIFLHKRQANGILEDGQEVEVFLYYDNQKRITATMNKPIVDTDTAAFCTVVGVNPHIGVFLDVGLIKDLLLSRDDLSFKKKEWPEIGDEILIKLKISKNQLTAKIIPRYDVKKYLTPTTELIEGEGYVAYCVFIAEEGVVFLTKEGHYIYVYYKNMRKTYRLGEKAYVKISKVKLDHKYNGTLILQKELMLSKDAITIKNYLEAHGGTMSITDKSTPEEINEVFNMSKAAFKRGIGSLYKEKKIILDKDTTTLIKPIE
jgi:predicted RNA-binding protein (virulence factor B family)